ncbi:MAG TPA: DNA-directed RNA polymerase subunit H [Thermoplasmatales archaeon]|nr:DNA-directed RNA polymerase subunit H [Candidatus Thermoplasmatota archaeon]MDD5778000.1 DNA-directed RNA polymerase subunit H [Candidatus Thermoplasmatota archaeon]HDS58968.1 DNA-directed RNA polymerase subunit H [Thermoplasmatales archaeon]
MHFNILKHELVPYFKVLSREEVEKLLSVYGISKGDLPKMVVTDPVSRAIGTREGDVVKIVRRSRTAGESVAYRLIVGTGMGDIRTLESDEED